MRHNSKVHVLLTTYNGSKYLNIQLESLLKQTYTNWELIIRDDGSSDNTKEIINYYLNLDKRISFLEDSYGNLKSCQSFSILMEYAKPVATYVMFCDQDDIWMPNKIELSLNELQKAELALGEKTSLLVYSTYQLIDSKGSLIPNSPPVFPSDSKMNLLLAENYIYGCTTIINKSLLNKASPISKFAENHDYWTALTAIATNGDICYLNEPLLFYRQHQNNVSGSYKDAFLINRLKRLRNNTYNAIIRQRMEMFKDLFKIFKNELSNSNRNILEGYIKNISEGGFKAIAYCIKMDIRKLNFFQTVSYYIGILSGTH